MVPTALKAKHYSKSIGLFYKEVGDFTWRVSDCEELVGVTAFGTFIAVFEISFHNYGNEIPVRVLSFRVSKI